MSLSIYSDYATKLHSIEEELHSRPVAEELPDEIVHELNHIHEELSHLEMTASHVNQFAKTFLDELRQKTVTLYGEIEDFYHKHAIEVIRQDTENLSNDLANHKLATLLKLHIKELLQSYRPNLTERRVLVLASLVLEQTEALAGQEIVLDEAALMNAEMVIEEIAEYLGQEDKKGLRECMKRLLPEQRKIVLAYLDTSLLHDIKGATDNDKIVRFC